MLVDPLFELDRQAVTVGHLPPTVVFGEELEVVHPLSQRPGRVVLAVDVEVQLDDRGDALLRAFGSRIGILQMQQLSMPTFRLQLGLVVLRSFDEPFLLAVAVDHPPAFFGGIPRTCLTRHATLLFGESTD